MSNEWTSPDGRIRLINADCLAVRDSLPAVDAVITDPPYGMAHNTDSSRFSGGQHHHRARQFGGRSDWGDVKGDDQPFDPSPWLEYKRVVLWGSNHFAARLPVGTTLVWIKRMDGAFGSFLSDAEMAWMKGGHGVYCRRDLTMNHATGTKKRLHPTQKPVGIMSWCIEKCKTPDDGLVFDPYAGSFTTAIACIRTGRRFVGCEVDHKYWQRGIDRVKAEYARTAMFAGES
jgi:DNA modification methylase